MKRRDFITKSTLGAATAGALLSTGLNAADNKTATNASANGSNATNAKGDPITEVMTEGSGAKSGIHIGGIGAGGAELRKDGVFYNWNIANNNPRGSGEFLSNFEHHREERKKGKHNSFYTWEDDESTFFVVRYQEEGKDPIMKILQIESGTSIGNIPEHIYNFPWITGIEKIEYKARFPFANLKYTDSELPLEITLEAYSPFIPHDVKNSSLPVLYFNFNLKHLSDKPADVMLVASMKSQVGYDTMKKYHSSKVDKNSSYVMATMKEERLDEKASSWGQMTLASLSGDSSYHLGWEHRHPYYQNMLTEKQLGNVDDTEGRNYLKDDEGKKMGQAAIFDSVAISKKLKSGDSFAHSFAMSWFFPNNYDLEAKGNPGHYYTNSFKNSGEAAEYAITNKEDLYKKTKLFLDTYYDSSLPQYALDQVNSQLNTFITSSYLSKERKFGIFEGMSINQSWAGLVTTDVDVYGGVMVRSLFPELQIESMRVHKSLQSPTTGEVAHSIKKGFATPEKNIAGVSDRIDLAPQYVMKVCNDYFWNNDLELLKEFWPSMKQAMDYMVRERDLNGDKQPDMTGIMCSYDNFPMYGMASYVQSQWLAALSSTLECAKTLGDNDYIKKYLPIFDSGKKIGEEKLWNGKYYRLYNSDLKKMKTKDGTGREIEKDMSGVDEGCLTDQIIGQWAAHQSGLGYLFNKDHVKQALKEILKMSFKEKFGLRNCSWPGYDFYMPVPSDIWNDQGNTCWSGVELSFASFLMYEGFYEEGLKVTKTVDDRYRKCGRYWDHQEFGGHYYRPMGAWGIINGAAGLSINQGTYSFSPKLKEKNFKLFVSFPGGFGNLVSENGKVTLNVISGALKIKKLNVGNIDFAKTAKANIAGASATAMVMPDKTVSFDFKKTIVVSAKESIEIA
jgi:non-lysosomal glucosylceramidase